MAKRLLAARAALPPSRTSVSFSNAVGLGLRFRFLTAPRCQHSATSRQPHPAQPLGLSRQPSRGAAVPHGWQGAKGIGRAALAQATFEVDAPKTKRRAAPSTTSPAQRYEDLVASGEIDWDPRQEKTVELFEKLAQEVVSYTPQPAQPAPVRRPKPSERQQMPTSSAGRSRLLNSIFGSWGQAHEQVKPSPVQAPQRPLPSLRGPKGLYIWGSCGTGKTFLMDVFYNAVPLPESAKQRIHFHEWMIDVHDRLHRKHKARAAVSDKANTVWTAEAAMAQQMQLKKHDPGSTESADDIIEEVAVDMMRQGWLLCFDEFQVTHISDAIIMKRLFSFLFAHGAVVIATSNRPPEDLYLYGLNRPLFLPFIPMLRQFCDVHDISSTVDYRLISEKEEKDKRVFIYPNGPAEKALIELKFKRVSQGGSVKSGRVSLQGRQIHVPKAGTSSAVAMFRFEDLCDRALGAADYLAIANVFHTVFVTDIPRLTLQERDQVRRFITLIDAFYERHTKLVCTAAADPASLFSVTEEERETSIADEIFAWDRLVSRLMEMQSEKYLTDRARSMASSEFLSQYNLQALTEDDLVELWRRYDIDDSGDIDKVELRSLLEDIMERQKGNRNLSDEVVEDCYATMDLDCDGIISFDEFAAYFREFTTLG